MIVWPRWHPLIVLQYELQGAAFGPSRSPHQRADDNVLAGVRQRQLLSNTLLEVQLLQWEAHVSTAGMFYEWHAGYSPQQTAHSM